MNKKRLFLTGLLAIFVLLLNIGSPVSAAECGGVETSIIDCSETGSGAIGRIILDVLNIMTIGVGILGVLGITIVGIQYLTAGGNEEKTRKAKRRMLEIVLGLVFYALLYGFAQWLGITTNESDLLASQNSPTSSASQTTAPTRTQTNVQAVSPRKANNVQKFMNAADSLAKDIEKAKLVYADDTTWTSNFITTWEQAKKQKHINCFEYVSIALQKAGLLKKGSTFCLGNGTIGCIRGESIKNNNKFKIVASGINQSVGSLVESGKLKPGDIVGKATGWHTMIYHGKKDGKYYFYSVRPKTDGHGNQLPFTRDRIVWAQSGYQSNYPLGIIIRVNN